MDLSKIITVSGKSGLYRVVAQGRQAVIAESLTDGKRIPVHATLRVSTLDEIHMFTTGDDVPLKDVLTKIHEVAKGGASADPKTDDATLWKKLEEVLPNADRERIYPSDVRKLFGWYAELLKAGVFSAPEESKEEEKAKTEEGPAKKAGEKSAKVKASAAPKKGGPKPSGGGQSKSTAVRRGGQRGS